jgi:transposase
MKQFVVIGTDVSKATLDLCFKPSGFEIHITNDAAGFKTWFKELKKQLEPGCQLMIVMEHTGRYSLRFEKFLTASGIDYCKIPALQIKRSLGVIRGKDDRVDAKRIAEYGWLRKEILTADQPCMAAIQKLRDLLSLRAKLVKDRSGYLCRLKEIKSTGSYNKNDTVIKTQTKLVEAFTAEIRVVEQQIDLIIDDTKDLKMTSDLLRSIKGVGKIIAAYMIGCTENFSRFSNARKFNCYAGLAPFKHESGSSIRSSSRISHLANKQAKTFLNLAATCAIRCDKELKAYYTKRVAEGKRKMSCINIIRSKIVARMFAVIKRQTPFVEILAAA